MNDDDPVKLLDALKAEHRRLDGEIERLRSEEDLDSIRLMRLKKEKLKLKDEIGHLSDEINPDIIA